MLKGVNAHPLWTAGLPSATSFVQYLDAAHAAGLLRIRYDVNYASFNAAAITDLSALLAARGMRGMANLGYGGPNWPAPDPWTYAVAAGQVAALLNDGDELELWNEPNQIPQFAPARDPVGYAHLTYAAYGEAKAARPGVSIVAGALAFNDSAYLDAFLGAQPRPRFDKVSFHPYTNQAAPDATSAGAWFSFAQGIHDMQAKLAAHAVTVPLVLSECAWECDTTAKDEPAASFYRAAVGIARNEGVDEICAYHLGDKTNWGNTPVDGESPANALLRGSSRTPTLSFQAFASA